MEERGQSHRPDSAIWNRRNFPRVRPPNIVVPRPGQESVWDYPRPPHVEPVAARVRVEFGGRVLAESVRALLGHP